MSEFEHRLVLLFGIACIILGVLAIILLLVIGHASSLPIVFATVFFALGLASLILFLILQIKKREATLFRNKTSV